MTVGQYMSLGVPKPARKPSIRPRWTREGNVPLSSIQSLHECRAEIIIMRAPSMSDACETHAQPIEKPIVSLVPRLYRHSHSVMSSSLGTALRLLGSTVLTWDGHAR